MNKAFTFPIAEEDLKAIRKWPYEALRLPTISDQKRVLYLMAIMILGVLVLCVIKWQDDTDTTPLFIIPLQIILIFNRVWNQFAISEDGVLCVGRFVPWKRIRTYQFEELHTNHPAYYSPEIDCAYELKIKTRFSSVNCFVTSEAVKEKLGIILDAHLSRKQKNEKPNQPNR